MDIAALVVAACLLGQVVPGQPTLAKSNAHLPDADAPLAPVKAPRFRQSPPELLSRLVTPPQTESLPGRPISLADVLIQTGQSSHHAPRDVPRARAAERDGYMTARERQLAAVQAYWKLNAALATYHVCRDETAQLKALQTATASAPGNNPLEAGSLALDLATASARSREAEIQAAAAQQDLAERLGSPDGQPLPLPLDQPHVGSYRSHFDTLFANRTPPPRIKLIDHALPLRRAAIDRRAEAVQAAHDALATAREFYDRGEIGPDLVAARLGDLGRQQIAFLDAVRDYNADIAEYACSVATPSATPAALLSMLIKDAAAQSGLRTFSGDKPLEAADRRSPAEMLRDTLPPRNALTPAAAPQGASAHKAPAPVRSIISELAPPPREAAAPRYPADLQPSAKRELRFKPTDDGASLPQRASDAAVYAELLSQPPAARAQHLAKLLHWDRVHPAPKPAAMSLAQCLANRSAAERRMAIDSYWKARERVARHQALAERSEQLASLEPSVLETRASPGGPELMLQFRAVHLDAQSDLLDEQVRLLVAQFELAGLLPSTLPHAGGYPTKAEPSAAARAVGSWHAALVDRAEATLRADGLRAADTQQFEQGRQSCEAVLAGIERQSATTLSFLETLTRYNLAIADYVLLTPAAQASAEQLAEALVIHSP